MENKSIIKIIDMLIDQAENADLYIEYIALGSRLMSKLAEEISILIDPENSKGLLIKSLSTYREVFIRETEVESVNVKYLFNREEWIPLN